MQEFADENLDLPHRDTVQIYGRHVLALESEGKSDIIRSTLRLRWEKIIYLFLSNSKKYSFRRVLHKTIITHP